MTGLLSAGWWDGVAAIAGVLSLGSLVSALVLWARSRHRLDDGRIIMDSWRGPDGRWMLRMRNVGEVMCDVRLVLVRGTRPVPSGPMTAALPPAGERLWMLDPVDADSEVVVFYVTALDTRTAWAERFRPGTPDAMAFGFDADRALPRRARREIRYRGMGPAFLNSGAASHRRAIRLGPPGGGNAAMRRMVAVLVSAGFHSPVIGGRDGTAADTPTP